VQVLEHEQHRRVSLAEGRKCPLEQTELRPSRPGVIRCEVEPERPERLCERLIGKRAAEEVEAAADETGEALALIRRHALSDETRLADAGVAADERDRTVTVDRRGERRFEPRELLGAPDEAPHRRSIPQR
jgi:hypothetical protein